MGDTSINWTDKVWNPVRGCSRVSPGCGGAAGEGGCYAERFAARFSGAGLPYEGLVRLGKQGPRWTGVVRFVPEMLDAPLRWRKPQRIFVNSMSDLFHERLTNEEIARVFGVMAAASRHTFQVLTKRPGRMREWFAWIAEEGAELLAAVGEEPPGGSPIPGACATYAREKALGGVLGDADWREAMRVPWPLPNVWLGVTAEDQARLDERVPLLLDTPAAVRWVSAEPLLGPLSFDTWIRAVSRCGSCEVEHAGLIPDPCPSCGHESLISTWGDEQLERLCNGERHENWPTGRAGEDGAQLHWIVVGGESGPGARPCAVEWIEDVVDQCLAANVPCWVKQLGACVVSEHRTADAETQAALVMRSKWAWQAGLRDRAGADIEEFPDGLRVREMPGAVDLGEREAARLARHPEPGELPW